MPNITFVKKRPYRKNTQNVAMETNKKEGPDRKTRYIIITSIAYYLLPVFIIMLTTKGDEEKNIANLLNIGISKYRNWLFGLKIEMAVTMATGIE